MESFALVSSSGGCGNSFGGFYGDCGGLDFHGGRCTGGHGDKKCDHCGNTNHIEPYCWLKYGKPDYVNQVVNGATKPQPTSTPSRHITSSFGSYNALTT